MKLISQGAEAKLYLSDYLGDKVIIKERFSKSYRHEILDRKITEERVKSECKMMARVRKLGINVPYLLKVDQRSITMMYVDGLKLKDYLVNDCAILTQVAEVIAKLHNGGIIHGDLTTSNMMVKDNHVFLIDFGLSYVKNDTEDQAVDLYVLEKAFLSTHPLLDKEFDELLKVYGKLMNNGQQVLQKLDAVRQRGRKKIAFG